ncbi:MAG TPA: DUF305 domain-containing protein, partial [Rhodopila sp.]|nr:DUF305 domain-containing protein [Rhodopila sp.]
GSGLGEKSMRRRGRWGSPGVLALLFIVSAVAHGRCVSPDDFAAATGAAMMRMDRDMMVAPTGDSDLDFAAVLIPEHQGAIDMAKVEHRFGHDPILRRLAQGIIVECWR